MTDGVLHARAETLAQRLARPTRTAIIGALLAGVLVAGIVAAAILRQTPVYQSRTVMLIDQPLALAAAGNEGVFVKLNALRVRYLILAGTDAVIVPAAQKLNMPPGRVLRSLVLRTPVQLLTMDITARANKPASAQQISSVVAQQVIDFAKAEQEANKIPETQRVSLSVVVPARPGFKLSPTSDRALTVAGISGGLTLGGVYLILQLLTSRRTDT